MLVALFFYRDGRSMSRGVRVVLSVWYFPGKILNRFPDCERIFSINWILSARSLQSSIPLLRNLVHWTISPLVLIYLRHKFTCTGAVDSSLFHAPLYNKPLLPNKKWTVSANSPTFFAYVDIWFFVKSRHFGNFSVLWSYWYHCSFA